MRRKLLFVAFCLVGLSGCEYLCAIHAIPPEYCGGEYTLDNAQAQVVQQVDLDNLEGHPCIAEEDQ